MQNEITESAELRIVKEINENFKLLSTQISEMKEEMSNIYVRKDQLYIESITRLQNPEFQKACYPIIHQYLIDPCNGKPVIRQIFNEGIATTRDSAIKWWDLAQKIIALVVVVGAIITSHNINANLAQVQESITTQTTQRGE